MLKYYIMKPMLIFDLDGTLWDSSENVAVSWNIVLNKPEWAALTRGMELTAADIRSVMGRTMADIADEFFSGIPEKTMLQMMHECETFEVEYIAEHGGNLFPEVRETLEELVRRGYKLAVVSNCQKGYINAFFKSMKMEELFIDCEEWGNTLRQKDENMLLVAQRNGFTKGNAFYVGDIQKDCDSTHKAGMPFIFASYGFGTCCGQEYTLREFCNLLEIFV